MHAAVPGGAVPWRRLQELAVAVQPAVGSWQSAAGDGTKSITAAASRYRDVRLAGGDGAAKAAVAAGPPPPRPQWV